MDSLPTTPVKRAGHTLVGDLGHIGGIAAGPLPRARTLVADARSGDRAGDQLSGAQRSEEHGREFRSLRERVAATGWRRKVAARRSVHHTYRLVVGAVGTLIVVVGIVTIPLPGPGWLTVIFGLLVLATEFLWAERLLGFTRRHVGRWTDWVGTRPPWERALLAVATAAFVYGAVVVALHLTGVPGWVPGWLPLWR